MSYETNLMTLWKQNEPVIDIFGACTCSIGSQWRLGWAPAYAQSHQSICCSYLQSMKGDLTFEGQSQLQQMTNFVMKTQ